MARYFFFITLLLVGFGSFAQPGYKTVRVIFDTDMGPDYDDVGAITLLHAFADSGYCTILATNASTHYDGVAGVLNVLNTYFNREGIPIGIPASRGLYLRDQQHWTDSLLANYPHSVQANSEVPGAVEVYRRRLAEQPDQSVTIITVGFLTNLYALLQSTPDSLSPLDGLALVKRKVKQLVCMGGRFPKGSEFNLKEDAEASRYVFDHWPGSILFSGVEIGWKIRTGLPLIRNSRIRHSPVKDVFRICIPQSPEDSAGRMSWDETAVLVAIKGFSPWYRIHKGTIQVNEDGSNTWENKGSKHGYLVEVAPPSKVEAVINRLMQHQPAGRKSLPD